MTDATVPPDRTREAAAAAMARLDAARTDPQIPFRDLAPFAAGNGGVPYAFAFDSGRAGPHVVVTALAHGNEPAGREAVTTLLEREVRPLVGRLTLILCNLAAYGASNGVDPYGRRFVEQDFNRVWSDAILDGPDRNVELDRARQVRALIGSADLLLDVHSTPYEATPFWPLRPGRTKARALAEALGAPRTLLLFDQGSVHSPTIARYGRLGDEAAPGVGATVECGLFFARTGADVALSTIGRLLRHAGMVDARTADGLIVWEDPGPDHDAPVGAPEIARTTDVRLLFRPETFEPVAAGEIVGWDGDRPIRAPHDGAVPLWIKQTFVAGEQAFMWARHAEA